jgi:hypothetical protein
MKLLKLVLLVVAISALVLAKKSLRRRKITRGDKKLNALCEKNKECSTGLECSERFCKKSSGQNCEKDTECASYVCTMDKECLSKFKAGLVSLFSK